MRVESEVNDRAYQTGVMKLNRYKKHPVLGTDVKEGTQAIPDPHWIEEIEKGKVDSMTAALREQKRPPSVQYMRGGCTISQGEMKN